MPTAPDNHDAHDYAERIRERLPRRLQELREACGLSMYALWMKCGVSRDMITSLNADIQQQATINDLNNAIANALRQTSNKSNGVGTLVQGDTGGYDQHEMQNVLDKIDELINALRR